MDRLVDDFLLAYVSCLSSYGTAHSCMESEGGWRQLEATSIVKNHYIYIHISPMEDQSEKKAMDFLRLSMRD